MKHKLICSVMVGCSAAFLLAFAACENKDAEDDAPAQNTGLAGRWFVRGGNWDRTMDLTQSGDSVDGIVTAPRGNGSQSVSGTISGTTISLVSGDVTGSGVIDGQSMRGEYSRTNGDSGQWRAWR